MDSLRKRVSSRRFGGSPRGGDRPDSFWDDSEIGKQRKDQADELDAQVFIGWGQIGYFNPYAFLRLPFRIVPGGSMIPQLGPFVLLATIIGELAFRYELSMDERPHKLLAFVLGFLLVIMGSFANNNYENAVVAITGMVQAGTTCCCDLFGTMSGR